MDYSRDTLGERKRESGNWYSVVSELKRGSSGGRTFRCL